VLVFVKEGMEYLKENKVCTIFHTMTYLMVFCLVSLMGAGPKNAALASVCICAFLIPFYILDIGLNVENHRDLKEMFGGLYEEKEPDVSLGATGLIIYGLFTPLMLLLYFIL